MSLYCITITYHVVVESYDEISADQDAFDAVEDGDIEACETEIKEIHSPSDLPVGWDLDCTAVNADQTLAEYFEEQKAKEKAAKERADFEAHPKLFEVTP